MSLISVDYVVVALVAVAVVLFVVWFCTHNREHTEDTEEWPEVRGGLSKEEVLFLDTDYVIADPCAERTVHYTRLPGCESLALANLDGFFKAFKCRFPTAAPVSQFIDDNFEPRTALMAIAKEHGFSISDCQATVDSDRYRVWITAELRQLEMGDMDSPGNVLDYNRVTVHLPTGLMVSSVGTYGVLEASVASAWRRAQYIQDRALAMCDIKSRTETVLVEYIVGADKGSQLKAWDTLEEYRRSFYPLNQDGETPAAGYRNVYESPNSPGELLCFEAREFSLWEFSAATFNKGLLNKSESVNCGDYRQLLTVPVTKRQKENMVDNRSIHAFMMSERRRLFQRNERAVQQISEFVSRRDGMAFKSKFFRTDAEPVEHDGDAVVSTILTALPEHHARDKKARFGAYPLIQITDVEVEDDTLTVHFISNYVALGTVQLSPA